MKFASGGHGELLSGKVYRTSAEGPVLLGTFRAEQEPIITNMLLEDAVEAAEMQAMGKDMQEFEEEYHRGVAKLTLTVAETNDDIMSRVQAPQIVQGIQGGQEPVYFMHDVLTDRYVLEGTRLRGSRRNPDGSANDVL